MYLATELLVRVISITFIVKALRLGCTQTNKPEWDENNSVHDIHQVKDTLHARSSYLKKQQWNVNNLGLDKEAEYNWPQQHEQN